MSSLDRWLWQFRAWLFKKVFGFDPRAMTTVIEYNKLLRQHVDELANQVEEVQALSLETVDLTGGPGWVPTIQNAIMSLDTRVDQLKDVMVEHQHSLEAIAAQEKQLVEMASTDLKNNLN